MDMSFGRHLRVPRLKPLVNCLALALAMGTVASTDAFALPKHEGPQRAALVQGVTSGIAARDPSAVNPRAEQWKQLHPQRPPHAPATTWIVTNCDDDGLGSLRDIIVNDALSGDTVDMSGLAPCTISLTTGAIITGVDDLTLVGPGKLDLIIDGGHTHPGLVHLGAGTLIVRDMSVWNGYKYSTGANPAPGGCIYSQGVVSMDNATAKYCDAAALDTGTARGGGVYAIGGVNLLYSTVSGNTVSSDGGSALGGGVFTPGSAVFKYSSINGNTSVGPSATQSRAGGAWVTGGAFVSQSTVAQNQAAMVGGLLLADLVGGGALSIYSSTISENIAYDSPFGAGLYAGYSDGVTISNSTITGNIEQNAGNTKYGAGLNLGPNTPATLVSSIISGNLLDNGSTTLPSDISGDSGSSLAGDHNLIAFSQLTVPPDTIGLLIDPGLGPLQYNGGSTRTHALLGTSLALNAGNANGQSYDQRGAGFPRVIGIEADIGAFESDIIFANGFD